MHTFLFDLQKRADLTMYRSPIGHALIKLDAIDRQLRIDLGEGFLEIILIQINKQWIKRLDEAVN
jgi:hypothetical protein